MKLGFVSAILDNCSFEEVIDTAASIGYECVEVACWPVEKASRRYAGVTHIHVEELDAEKIQKINDYCKQKNVAISALAYYPNVLTEDHKEQEKIKNHLIAMIEAAPKLHVDTRLLRKIWNYFKRSGNQLSRLQRKRKSELRSKTVRCSLMTDSGQEDRT